MAEKKKRFSRRTIALFWLAAVAIVIGVLIRYEMIPVLYVIATLALVSLLVLVSFADLEKIGAEHFAKEE